MIDSKPITVEAQIKLLRCIRKAKWRIPIQFFQDPSVSRADKELFVAILHAKNWIHLLANKDDGLSPPAKLVNLVKEYETKMAFFTIDKRGRTALHKACLHHLPLNEIENMIRMCGEELLMSRNKRSRNRFNALNYACISGHIDAIRFLLNEKSGRALLIPPKKNKHQSNALLKALELHSSKETIKTLIDFGGKDLVLDECKGVNSLDYAILNRSCCEIFEMLLEKGGRDSIMHETSKGRTKLSLALLLRKPSLDVIALILKHGGKELVQRNLRIGGTSCSCIHFALMAFKRVKSTHNKIRILRMLIDVGGKELLLRANSRNMTPLNLMFHHDKMSGKDKIIQFLILCGGKEVLMSRYSSGFNHLMIALVTKQSNETIDLMLDVGGIDLVLDKSDDGLNAFQSLCSNSQDEEKILKLVRRGGKALSMNDDPRNLIFLASDFVSFDVFKTMIEIGGEECLNMHYSSTYHTVRVVLYMSMGGSMHFSSPQVVKKINFILRLGIQYSVGGEFAIGGLLFDKVKHESVEIFYKAWYQYCAPALEMDREFFQGQPLLQAALYHKAPSHVVKYLITNFQCIANRDSFGNRAIEVAINESVHYRSGMNFIIESMAKIEKKSIIHTCAKYGLKWCDGMNLVADLYANQIGTIDDTTGLCTYMLAAEGKRIDLDSIFALIRMRPDLIAKKFNGGQSQKRSREETENEETLVVRKRFKQMIIERHLSL